MLVLTVKNKEKKHKKLKALRLLIMGGVQLS